jgi:hypothetical protein
VVEISLPACQRRSRSSRSIPLITRDAIRISYERCTARFTFVDAARDGASHGGLGHGCCRARDDCPQHAPVEESDRDRLD